MTGVTLLALFNSSPDVSKLGRLTTTSERSTKASTAHVSRSPLEAHSRGSAFQFPELGEWPPTPQNRLSLSHAVVASVADHGVCLVNGEDHTLVADYRPDLHPEGILARDSLSRSGEPGLLPERRCPVVDASLVQ